MTESKNRVYGHTSMLYWKDLQKIFGLPDHCRKAVITLEVNEMAIAECEIFTNLGEPETIIKRYKLVEINEQEG